jgi:NADPH-dependent curcumin reductase CurA
VPREVRLRRHAAGAAAGEDFHVVEVPMPEPADGEVLVRNTWTSVDPAIRIRLAARAPAGYFRSFRLEAPMDGIMTVGEVVESRAEGFVPGDTVWHGYGWREYAAVPPGAAALGELHALRRLDTTIAPAQAYLGPLGGMGLTAYVGLFDVAELRDGDVVWVSAAAGAVGSLVAQLAKLRGHAVIGSAGSDEYQRDRPVPGPDNLFQAVANDLTLRGFRASSYMHRIDAMQREIAGWLWAGRLRYRETVFEGLERAPEALARMLAGDTVGKTLVRIA